MCCSCFRHAADVTVTHEVTVGMKVTQSHTVTVKVGLEMSIVQALGYGPISAKATTTLTLDLGYSFTHETEREWSQKKNITRVYPANQVRYTHEN